MMQSRAASSLLAQLSRAIGHECAQNELRWMRQTLDRPPASIYPTARSVEEMVSRRIRGEPLQYILGSQPFGPLMLAVRPPVLIPRPETEDWALRLADLARDTFCSLTTNRPLSILDLCTGTGCIPMLLLRTLPAGSAHATGIDISEDAVSLARENADLCDISVHADNSPRPSRRLQQPVENTFKPVLADLMHPDFIRQARLTPPYDIITSNPPYIPKVEYDRLPASVKDYEDIRALVGDPAGVALPTLPAADRDKGLTFYHRIAELVRDHDLLAAEGTLALEVGDGQAQDVAAILEGKAAMRRIDVWRDPWEKERVVVAHR